jgi:subtilase family serine protease
MAMNTMLALTLRKQLRVCGWVAACAMAATTLGAQLVTPRISSEITSSEQTTLKGSLHPLAKAQFDSGRVPGATKLNGISIVFSRSAAQEADLKALIAQQQNPASPLFHKWLTPDEFAARYGMASSDLEKVQNWLLQQGFSIDSVARSRDAIRFSGTSAQVERAFSTQMHFFQVEGKRHFAPSTDLSIPAAIGSSIAAVRNLNDFRPRPMHVRSASRSAKPAYTYYGSDSNQYVAFAPGDIAVAYGLKTLSQQGYTGAGQSIAVLGQSAIQTSDITNFQDAAGLNEKLPTLVLVPTTGTSTLQADGDEGESDLDLEWSSATAPGADILFVYTGGDSNAGVFDSLIYAVEQNLAPIITLSYGSCETALDQADLNTMEPKLEEGESQGQTIIASSGDSGSTACYGYTGTTDGGTTFTTAMDEALAVNYPASSEYVTGVGGTEITAANDQVGTYWASAPSSNTITLTSALSHIPEVAWNDDGMTNCATYDVCMSSTGGGISALISRPTWQTGVSGIPAGTKRLVPDVSLYASPNYPGYLYCTSDQSDWSTNQQGSCGSAEFYDPNSFDFTIAGGTSFAAPIFAGMVAVINQKMEYTGGQGLINPTLYSMAADPTTYGSAFYDITSGTSLGTAGVGNECLAGTSYCSSTGKSEYPTTTGYDEATGLGSVNLVNLIDTWTPPTAVATLIGTSTTITANNASPNAGATVIFTITVTASDGATTPTGNVALSIDGGGTADYSNNGTTATVALTASSVAGTATATYQTSFSTAGTHQIVATFPGISSSLATSVGVVQVAVGTTSSGSGTFTLAATNVTVSQGSSGSSTVTITSANSYSGTVDLSMTTTSSSLINYGCYDVNNTPVTANKTATATLTLYTSESDCSTAAVTKGAALHTFAKVGTKRIASSNGSPALQKVLPLSAAALAGVLFFGIRRRRVSKWWTMLSGFVLLGVLSLAVGCGSSSTTSTSNNYVAKGTYTLTLIGVDSTTSSITAQTTFTLTVD